MRVLWPVYNLHEEQNQYLGIMGISSILRQGGFGVEVVPADYHALADRLIGRASSTVLAFSTPTPYARYYIELNRNLKERFPETYSVFGGPHATFFPEMIDAEGVDAVCIGEGEGAMLELVQGLAERRTARDIDNLWVKEGGEIHRNPVRPLVENLDSLPLPDHLIFTEAMPAGVSQTLVMASRGCPYSCTYCYNNVYLKLYRGKGKILRRRSVDHVLEELRGVKAAGFRLIRFVDDLFIGSPAWCAEFCERYRREIGIPFSCEVRPDHVTEDLVRMLKSAGCVRMMMGFEAANDEIRASILNRKMSKESMARAAGIVKSHGLRLVTANIIGIPGGTFETDWETLELNVRCRPNYASVSFMQPYPRTEMHRIARDRGVFDDTSGDAVEGSFGFGGGPAITYENVLEYRMVSNLQKFFQLGVRLPFVLPVIRRLVKVRPNRVFTFAYHCTVNWALCFSAIPPRIGLPMLWRKIKLRRRFKGPMSSGPSGGRAHAAPRGQPAGDYAATGRTEQA